MKKMLKRIAGPSPSRTITALLLGGISATGFAPLGLWPVGLACFALLFFLLLRSREGNGGGRPAFRLGWFFGVGHFCVGLNWIAGSFRYQDAMPVWLGWIAVFLLSLYLAIYPALALWGTWRVRAIVEKMVGKMAEKRAATSPHLATITAFSFAAFWIITEWLRSWVFTGFAWNPAAVMTVSTPLAASARLVGTYGLSGLTLLLAATLALLLQREWRAATIAIFPPAIITAAAFMTTPPPVPSPRPMVTIVQPGIGQQDKYQPGYEELNFAKLAQLSRPLTGQGPRLLLWPEAAIPDYLEDGYPARYYQYQYGGSAAGARFRLSGLLGPDDILLTGARRLIVGPDRDLTGARNSVSAMDAYGRLYGHYDKAHLVPYGEYLALRWLLEPLGATRLVPGDLDFIPGPGPQNLDLGPFGRPGPQICYEIIFSGQVVDRQNRPDFLFNPSNDAWFGAWGPPQHLAQARLRAVEEGLPVVRATPTGVSALVDADGRLLRSLPLGTAGRIDAHLPAARAPTLFAQHGNILPLLLAIAMLLPVLLTVVRHRRTG